MSLEPGFKVKLLRDLSRYHAPLKPGVEGVTELPAGRSALFRSDYLKVRFGEKLFDVRLSDLEITDPRWLAMQAEEKKAREDALANHVKRAVLYTGARGGFLKLVIEFSNERPNEILGRKQPKEARPLIDSLRARGLLTEEKG